MPRTAVRTYRSPKRAEQAAATRSSIILAATRQFTDNGYAATSVRAIAAAAGVSVPSVELHFHSKPQLLKASIDVAIAGDDEPVPVLQRSWAAQAESDRTVQGFLACAAEVLCQAQCRSAGIILTAYEAAKVDSDMGELVRQLEAGRAGTARWVVTGVSERVPLRLDLGIQDAIDIVWLLMDPVVFSRLTGNRGWTDRQYRNWFIDSVQRLLASTTIATSIDERSTP